MTPTPSVDPASDAKPVLAFSDRAKHKLREIIQGAGGEEAVCLRVYVVGGGCSGLQYGFALEETSQEDDTCIVVAHQTPTGEAVSFNVIVDSMSLVYLQGSTIEYHCDVQGERFGVNNPHAKTTCGCGSSFSIE